MQAANDTPEDPAIAAEAPTGSDLPESGWEAGAAVRAFDPKDLHAPILLPLCTPVFALDEGGDFKQQRVILPDYCYNDGVAARLGERVMLWDSHMVSNPVKPTLNNGDNVALPRSQGPLTTGSVDGSEPPLSEVEALQPARGFSMEQQQPAKAEQNGEHAQGSTYKELQQLNALASHAALAREIQPQNSLDRWASSSLKSQVDMPVAPTAGCCIWLGKVSHDVGVLPPGGSARAEFTAFFPCPGIYNLNTVKAQVHLVTDEAAGDGIKRRHLGGPSRRSSLARRCRGTAASSPAQLVRSGWPASDTVAFLTFPFDFLVHVVPSDSA